MHFKIKASTQSISIVGIAAVLIIGLTSVARTQPYSASVSADASTAQELSQQAAAKAEVQDYRGAIADLTQAIGLNPNEAEFYYQRGLILKQLSDRQAALRDFNDAILRDPNHAWAYLQRAGLSFNLGSSYQITDYRGFNYQIVDVIGDRRSDARAVLDLRTARDLFVRQGDRVGIQTAEQLIEHFVGIETEAE